MSSKQFSLLGFPLGHTMSPFIHKKLFLMNGINADYTSVELSPEKFSQTAESLRGEFDGCNVTIPYKSEIINFLDEIDERASLYGAVNTVAVENGRLKGYNTDCIGFLRALEHAGIALKGRVLVCGAGGASRMMAFESVLAGCDVTVAVRESGMEKGEKLSREISGKLPGKTINVCLYEDLNGHFDIILNGTPAGMYPNTDTMAVSEEVIKNSDAVFDAVYNPRDTKLLETAQMLGKKCGYGMVMLVWQAAAAQEIWFKTKFNPDEINNIIRLADEEMNRKFSGKKSIVLCGFMGCGKSTVGKILAEKLNFEFIDMDSFIEKKAGKSVAEIFKDDGEERFRALEREACEELGKKKNAVIASGGGALTFPKNTVSLKECEIILLNVKSDILIHRIQNDSQPRPVFERAMKNGTVTQLIDERLELYRRAATKVIDIDEERAPEEIADEVIKIIS